MIREMSVAALSGVPFTFLLALGEGTAVVVVVVVVGLGSSLQH